VEFWTSVRVIARWWYVALGSLLIFALVGMVLVRSVAPTYDASGSVVLLNVSQPTDAKATQINPFQTADYQANQFALIMQEVLTDDVMKDRLEARGVPRDYSITNSTNQTPVLFIMVHGTSADGALQAYATVLDQLRKELHDRQEVVKAPSQTLYTAVDLSVPAPPAPKTGSKVQLAIFLVVIAVTVSIALALLTEAVANARTRRRRSAGGGPMFGFWGPETPDTEWPEPEDEVKANPLWWGDDPVDVDVVADRPVAPVAAGPGVDEVEDGREPTPAALDDGAEDGSRWAAVPAPMVNGAVVTVDRSGDAADTSETPDHADAEPPRGDRSAAPIALDGADGRTGTVTWSVEPPQGVQSFQIVGNRVVGSISAARAGWVAPGDETIELAVPRDLLAGAGPGPGPGPGPAGDVPANGSTGPTGGGEDESYDRSMHDTDPAVPTVAELPGETETRTRPPWLNLHHVIPVGAVLALLAVAVVLVYFSGGDGNADKVGTYRVTTLGTGGAADPVAGASGTALSASQDRAGTTVAPTTTVAPGSTTTAAKGSSTTAAGSATTSTVTGAAAAPAQPVTAAVVRIDKFDLSQRSALASPWDLGSGPALVWAVTAPPGATVAVTGPAGQTLGTGAGGTVSKLCPGTVSGSQCTVSAGTYRYRLTVKVDGEEVAGDTKELHVSG
jgi:hypothetical protein